MKLVYTCSAFSNMPIVIQGSVKPSVYFPGNVFYINLPGKRYRIMIFTSPNNRTISRAYFIFQQITCNVAAGQH